MNATLKTTLALVLGSAALVAAPQQADTQGKATQGKKDGKAAKPKAKRSHARIKTSMGEIVVELFDEETPMTVKNFLGLAEGEKAGLNPKTGKMEKRNFYDGLIFHRVIDGFMAQGGCPKGNGTGDPGYRFGDEISAKSLGLDKTTLNAPRGVFYLSRPEQQKIIGPIYEELGIRSQADYDRNKEKLTKRLGQISVQAAYQRLGYSYDDSRSSHRMRRFTLAMANSGPGTNGSQFFINFKNNEYLNGRHTVFGKVVSGQDVVMKIAKVKTDRRTNRPVEPVKIVSIRRTKWSAKKGADAQKKPGGVKKGS